MSEKESETKVYLGDGVYANTSDYGIVLTTEDGVQITNTIYLEPDVFSALLKFAKDVEWLKSWEWDND